MLALAGEIIHDTVEARHAGGGDSTPEGTAGFWATDLDARRVSSSECTIVGAGQTRPVAGTSSTGRNPGRPASVLVLKVVADSCAKYFVKW